MTTSQKGNKSSEGMKNCSLNLTLNLGPVYMEAGYPGLSRYEPFTWQKDSPSRQGAPFHSVE